MHLAFSEAGEAEIFSLNNSERNHSWNLFHETTQKRTANDLNDRAGGKANNYANRLFGRITFERNLFCVTFQVFIYTFMRAWTRIVDNSGQPWVPGLRWNIPLLTLRFKPLFETERTKDDTPSNIAPPSRDSNVRQYWIDVALFIFVLPTIHCWSDWSSSMHHLVISFVSKNLEHFKCSADTSHWR